MDTEVVQRVIDSHDPAHVLATLSETFSIVAFTILDRGIPSDRRPAIPFSNLILLYL